MSYKHLVFPQNSKFLITGGAGFIGSNLCEAILDMGYKVVCLDDLSTGKQKNIQPFINNSKFNFIKGDIRNYDMCLYATKDTSYVLHQAAWGSVPRSIKMPLLYSQINIIGTLNMMEASLKNKVKKFVYASSSSVYGDNTDLPKIEGREGRFLSPYALTKKTNEEYGRLYKKLYNLDTFGLRYFNVFGRRQDPDGAYAAVIPKFIKMLINDEVPIIYGDGTQSRDFTYIENVIEANLKACLASSDVAGESYNIAFSGCEKIKDIYYYITKSLNKNIEPIYGSERIGDIKHSYANIDRAKDCLKYNPEWSFKQGIDEAIDWYKDNIH